MTLQIVCRQFFSLLRWDRRVSQGRQLARADRVGIGLECLFFWLFSRRFGVRRINKRHVLLMNRRARGGRYINNRQFHRFLLLRQTRLKFVTERSDGNANHQVQQERDEYRPQNFLSFASRLHRSAPVPQAHI